MGSQTCTNHFLNAGICVFARTAHVLTRAPPLRPLQTLLYPVCFQIRGLMNCDMMSPLPHPATVPFEACARPALNFARDCLMICGNEWINGFDSF